ncbi:hypothetical protein [Paenibacillus monticola]|uniref:Uncharacterized protein n=1 Tax=Paenibacillus monticola TaxID=2666075 RepID=A0A7X2H220_9BACL|nr:hypothetical protein [Paenibacillus monticola]MRN51958.1 hypothetical protein [Paenibacillus monticola]
MTLSIIPNTQYPTIQANQITITAKDQTTGITAEQTLSIVYKENQYGIWLEGTDEFGDSQAIVIFTNEGSCRMDELLATNHAKEDENIENDSQHLAQCLRLVLSSP